MSLSLPSGLFESLGGLLTAVIAAAAAFGGLVKFFAWFNDRQFQMRIDSASALANNATKDRLQQFGTHELLRAHFARLTGIRYAKVSHDVLLIAHKALGGHHLDWEALKKSSGQIKAHGLTLRVQKFETRDYIGFSFLAALSFFFAMASVALLTYIGTVWLNVLPNPAQAISLFTFVQTVMAGLYVGVLAYGAWVFYVIVSDRIETYKLRARIWRLGAKARKAARKEYTIAIPVNTV